MTMTHQQIKTFIEPFKEGILPSDLKKTFKDLVEIIDQLVNEPVQIQLGDYVISREKNGRVWITHTTHEAMMLDPAGKELADVWKQHF